MNKALDDDGLIQSRYIVEIIPTETYLAVVLDNGAHGWALSYAESLAHLVAEVERSGWSRGLPAKEALSVVCGCDPAQLALRVALVSALATPLWAEPEKFGYAGLPELPPHGLQDVESAVVVGFGGLMFNFLLLPGLRSLHVMDLAYEAGRAQIEPVVDIMRTIRRDVAVHVSPGDPGDLQAADLVSITGSALCNGTIDRLLAGITGRPIVLVQGQSAAVHPRPFFERNVAALISTRKRQEMLQAARSDQTGHTLRKFVESARPRMCLLPNEVADVRRDGM